MRQVKCKCGNVLFPYDKKRTICVKMKCSKCGKYLIYNPSDKKVRVASKPSRTQASGIRFY